MSNGHPGHCFGGFGTNGVEAWIPRDRVPADLLQRYDVAIARERREKSGAARTHLMDIWDAVRDHAILDRAGHDAALTHAYRPASDALAKSAADASHRRVGTLPQVSAGIALATAEGHVLFLRRGDQWQLPAAEIKPGESAAEAAVRAAFLVGHQVSAADDFRHVITLAGGHTVHFRRIDDRFVPRLGRGIVAHRWALPDNPPSPLHPILLAALPAIVSEVTQFTMKSAAGAALDQAAHDASMLRRHPAGATR
jgi:hypothetical protein